MRYLAIAVPVYLLALGCGGPVALPAGDAEQMEKRILTVPMAGGLATGQDGKLIPIGKSDELQNVRPGRAGEAIMRNGTRKLGQTLIGSGATLPKAWALGTLRGDLVNFSFVGDHPANLYSPTLDSWATNVPAGAGVFASVKTNRRGPIMATRQQISGNGLASDVAYANGFYFVIYSTTRNSIKMLVEVAIDAATGEEVGETTRSGSFTGWGVRVVNGLACFVMINSTTAIIDSWPTATPASGPTARVSTAITASAFLTREFDILAKDATTISVAYSDGTNAQAFDYVAGAGVITAWTPKDGAGASIPSGYAISWMLDAGFGNAGKIALIVFGAGSVKVHWDIPTVGATRQAARSDVVDAAVASPCTLAGFTRASTATGEYTVLYEDGLQNLKMGTREGGSLGNVTYLRFLFLGSKPFVGQDGEFYVGTEVFSTTQPTRFVVRVPKSRVAANYGVGLVVAKVQVNAGYVGALGTGPLSAAVSPASGEFVYTNTVQLRLPGNPTAYVPQGVGVDLVHVKFQVTGAATGSPREAIDSLFTPGGTVGQFDGRSYVDAGFHYYPEQPFVSAGGVRTNAAGDYFYATTYAWTDANGRTWESAPSVVFKHTTAANTGANVFCRTERLADRDDITIRVYRGAINDAVTLQLAGTVVNDPTVDSVTFADTFSDTTVANGQMLYTNGAAGSRPLAADGIPGASALAVAANRAWLISNDNPYEVWMSNKFIAGQGWRFSEQNKLILNDSLGPCTAVAALPSGVVVIFKANAYYLVSGDGPNQAGNGGSFTVSPPVIGTGTTRPRSVLETPSGIEFRSDITPRSWYRVNTAQQAEYIGEPVERYTDAFVGGTVGIGSALIAGTGETRYYTSRTDGGSIRTLVHDPISDTWMIDVSPDDYGDNTAACAYGIGAAVSTDVGVFVDDPTTARDGPTPYAVRTVTPWIKGADLDGYAAFIEGRGVGEVTGSAPMTISMQADFDATTNIFTPQAVTPGPLWDWATKYPAKLSAFRFTVAFTPDTARVKMTAIVVEYGVKSTRLAPATYTKRSQ